MNWREGSDRPNDEVKMVVAQNKIALDGWLQARSVGAYANYVVARKEVNRGVRRCYVGGSVLEEF